MKKGKSEIRGLVAKILNTTQLVINRGSLHGVEVGMVFEVLDKEATDIIDPKTKKKLGSLDRPKVRVKVVIVDNNLCMAETFEIERVNEGGAGSAALGTLFLPPKWVDVQQTFKASDKAWEDLPEDKSFVKVGDPVRSVNVVNKAKLY